MCVLMCVLLVDHLVLWLHFINSGLVSVFELLLAFNGVDFVDVYRQLVDLLVELLYCLLHGLFNLIGCILVINILWLDRLGLGEMLHCTLRNSVVVCKYLLHIITLALCNLAINRNVNRNLIIFDFWCD